MERDITQADWDDFWYNSEDLDDDWFAKIWKEMDQIEPLTPIPTVYKPVSYTHLTLPTTPYV